MYQYGQIFDRALKRLQSTPDIKDTYRKLIRELELAQKQWEKVEFT
jgi:hypothetical protein